MFTECGYLTQGGECTSLYQGMEDIPPEYCVFAFPETEPKEKTSVLDKLASAKDEAAKTGIDKPDKSVMSNDPEL